MSTAVGDWRDREFIAAHRLIRLGYQPVALGEDEIRTCFLMERTDKCADMVFRSRPATFLVVECKGTDVLHAVAQLNSTARHIRKVYSHVAIDPEIIRSMPEPKRQPFVNIGKRYLAKYLPLTHGWLLASPTGQEMRLDSGDVIRVTFDCQ